MVFINTAKIAARKGFMTYTQRNGAYVPGRQLNKKQLAKGIFLHGYYWLGNAGGSYREPIQVSFSQPVSPGGVLFPHAFMVGAADQGGMTGKQVDFELFARRIMSLLSRKDMFYKPEEIISRYNSDYAAEIKSDPAKKLDQAIFNVALLLLSNSKRVEVNREGEVRFYGQDVLIKGASTALSAKLREAHTLHQLAEIVSALTSDLFRNVDLYLRDGTSGEVLIIAGDKEGSTYEKWAAVEPQGIFDVMFRRLKATNFRYIPDIRTEANEGGPIFPHNSVRYEERYAEPSEAIYCVGRVRGQAGHGVAVKFNEWSSAGEKAPNRSLYSENPEISREVIDGSIKGLITAIASKVHDIVSSQGGMTLKEIWQKEERGGNLLDRLMGVEGSGGISRPGSESAPMEVKYDQQREQDLWNWVYLSGTGDNVGLEAKIAGTVTEAHRRDFEMAIIGRLKETLAQGKVALWEDAAGETPLILRLARGLTENRGRLSGTIRDFADPALLRSRAAVGRAELSSSLEVKWGDMFKKSEQPDESVDFTMASMAFYCVREKFQSALTEWARIAKPGAMGWFSIKTDQGDLKIVVKDSIKGFWQAIPLWRKIFFPAALWSMGKLFFQRKRAGAFEYSKKLREGFEAGRYYAPTEAELKDDLAAAGLTPVSITTSLADQFWLVEWSKPGSQG